jgi:iron complex outermembrane recepter protein
MATSLFSRLRLAPVTAATAATGAALCGYLFVAPASAATAEPAEMQTVVISARPLAGPAVAGFGDMPLERSPLQAALFGTQQLADEGIRSLGGLTRLDASLGDAYNAEGYWSILSSRGYTLDNRFNYRRDGLPINAETAIALDNKSRIELLKGTSGIQAGTSAPGGLVNLVVKRPVGPVRSARIEARERSTVLGALDVGDRLGADGQIGVRLNAAFEHLDPAVRNAQGERWLLAMATDWRPTPDTLFEAEFEASHQRQPSVAGFSMLGDRVPDAKSIDPKLNLNHQPWGRPVDMAGNTASLRWQQQLGPGWRFVAHAMTQRLRSDDRTAFPYGVYNADYECPQWCDRFAPDGSFTYWEYISNNERRTSDVLDLSVSGAAATGPIGHAFQAGVLTSRYRGRFQDQVFDIAGTGRIDGSLETPPSAGFADANTNRDERNTELYLRDVMQLAPEWQLWAGLRHTRLDRSSVRTSPDADGSLRATRYEQSATTPWLALVHRWTPQTTLYASWGEGLESDVVPNRPRYTNAGQALPALKSRQVEVGIKHQGERLDVALAAFDIDRPQATDRGTCDAEDSCTRVIDGSARHRGFETQIGYRQGPWQLQASAMLLDAERRGSSQAGVNGLRPVNVPRSSLRMAADYSVAAVRGLALQAAVSAEGRRMVLPDDNSVSIPGWARLDLGARWRVDAGPTALTWRIGVDNATNQRAWKESPYQFGHVYLYPLPPRAWRASAELAF